MSSLLLRCAAGLAVLIAVIGAPLSAGPAGAVAFHSSPVSTTVIHGHIRVTLRVPRDTYPLDSLVRTTIVIRNIGRSWARVIDDSCMDSIQTDVLNGKGKVVYPPAFPGQMVADCPAYILGRCPSVRPGCLKPGHSITVQSIVYLRAATLRAKVGVSSGSIQGKSIHLTLTPALFPHVRLKRSGRHYIATIYPAPAHAGKLYVAQSDYCKQKDSSGFSGNLWGTWTANSGSTLKASFKGCIQFKWRFVAGWLGHTAFQMNLHHP